MKRNDRVVDILRYFAALIVVLVGIVAILGSSDDGDSDDNDDDGSGQSLSVTGASGNMVDLNGTWGGTCIANDDDDGSARSVVEISGSSFAMTLELWITSTDCSGQSDIRENQRGSFNLGEEVDAAFQSADVVATVVDITKTSAQLTIYNEDLIQSFNLRAYCGIDDWEAGVFREVIGLTCGPETPLKDIAYIDDTGVPDVWYFGDYEGPTDADGYPAEIDTAFGYERN